jgi:SAM-dependent methyltransferase
VFPLARQDPTLRTGSGWLAAASVLIRTVLTRTAQATSTAPAVASAGANDLIRTTSSPPIRLVATATYGTGSIGTMRMRKGWDAQAGNWVRFARAPGHDAYYELMNLPVFLDLLPAPGRRTLDLGCGEGRLSRVLAAAGHTMVATDASPRMAVQAATLPPAPATVVSDAARLPFTGGSFDLVVAFMCLHDIDRMADAVREAGRVLAPGGRLALAIPHPVSTASENTSHDPDAPLVIAGSYLDAHPADWTLDRGGVRVHFHSEHRPLEAYAAALTAAGLLIEQIREPKATPALVAAHPAAARWRRMPLNLHILALRPPR